MRKLLYLTVLMFVLFTVKSQDLIEKELILKWNDGNTNWTTSDAYSHIFTSGQLGAIYPFTNRGNLVFQPRAHSGSDIVFATGTTPIVRTVIKGNGMIGLGTNEPSNFLDVHGGIQTTKGLVLEWNDGNNGWITTDAFAHILTTGQNGTEYPFTNRGNLVFQPRANSGSDIVFATGATPIVRTVIKGNGYVGIGTPNPQSLLSVNGIITTKEVNVTLEGWSDFVFHKYYELKNLEEVENFIEENNHLPDVPSEKEVLESGINLGEMDAKLLQKIEELTLYVIDINKRVKLLEEENKVLKEENSILKTH